MIRRKRRTKDPGTYCLECQHPHDRHTHYGCDHIGRKAGQLYECPCPVRYYRVGDKELTCRCQCYHCRLGGRVSRHCSSCAVGKYQLTKRKQRGEI